MEQQVSSGKARAASIFLALLVVTIVAAFVPLLLLLRRPWWIVWTAVAVTAMGLIHVVNFRGRAPRPLTALETAAIGFSSLYQSAVFALLAVMLYAGIHFLGRLAGMVGWRGTSGALAAAAWYTGVWFGGLCLVTTVIAGGSTVAELMFPESGVGNAQLIAGIRRSKVLIFGSVTVAVLALITIAAARGHTGLYVLLQIALVVVSVPLELGISREKQTPEAGVIAALRALLEACGFAVVNRFQTGELGIDRVIAIFDLVAQRDGTLLAIQIGRQDPNAATPAYSQIAGTAAAVRSVYLAAEKLKLAVHSVSPLFVVTGTADEDLKKFAETQSIRVAEVPDHFGEFVIEAKRSPEDLRALALRYLQLTPPAVTEIVGSK